MKVNLNFKILGISKWKWFKYNSKVDHEYNNCHQIFNEKPKISKNEINLQLLKEFDYETIQVPNTDGNEPETIYKCTFEGWSKEFTRTWNMLDHARTHKGVKPFKCQWCPRQFTQKGNLQKHLKQHFEPTLNMRKKFKWLFCSSRYTEKYNYNVSIFFNKLVSISSLFLSN